MPAVNTTVLWSAEADEDLRSIWAYYVDAASRQTAIAILDKLFDAAELLGQYPRSGRARGELAAGLRSIAVGTHVVFYRLAGETVEILRVLDGRRDVGQIVRK